MSNEEHTQALNQDTSQVDGNGFIISFTFSQSGDQSLTMLTIDGSTGNDSFYRILATKNCGINAIRMPDFSQDASNFAYSSYQCY